MKTKEELVADLANKGPSYTLNYLGCFYKDVELLEETDFLDLLKNMSPEGQERFKKHLDAIRGFATRDTSDTEYKQWCEEGKKRGFSNQDLSLDAARLDNQEYDWIRVENDFYENCKIAIGDRVALTEDYGCFPKDFVGTVVKYSIAEKAEDYTIEVEFRLVNPNSNRLFGKEECSVPQDMLKVVEHWDPKKQKYRTRFQKNAGVFPDYEPIDLATLFVNDDKNIYDYPYRESENVPTTEAENTPTTEAENPPTTEPENPPTTEAENP